MTFAKPYLGFCGSRNVPTLPQRGLEFLKSGGFCVTKIFKVPITPKNVFSLVELLHATRKKWCNVFGIWWKPDFFYELLKWALFVAWQSKGENGTTDFIPVLHLRRLDCCPYGFSCFLEFSIFVERLRQTWKQSMSWSDVTNYAIPRIL